MPENNIQSVDSDDRPESQSMKQRNPEIEREITLEEFQPTGTLTLVLLYFVIIVLMWIFMYFIEFAGHGPSIMN